MSHSSEQRLWSATFALAFAFVASLETILRFSGDCALNGGYCDVFT
jgi:hypothetical protein